MTTAIEWVKNSDGSQGETWNPIVGCSKISPGCKNCYAETMARRLKAMGKPQYQGVVGDDGRWNGRVEFVESALEKPLKRKKPTMYFLGSMSDIFHEDAKEWWLDLIWRAMADCPQHTFQVLTKRADRMREYLSGKIPLPNVWLGVSVENQAIVDGRIRHLANTWATVRFLSCEPLLGPVDLTKWLRCYVCGGQGDDCPMCNTGYDPQVDWVIVGGESGPKARPCHPDWVRLIRDQCQAAGVPLFFKQWGAWKYIGKRARDNGSYLAIDEVFERVGKKAAGRLLDGREWMEYPQGAP